MEGRGSSIYLGLRVPWGQSIYCFGHMDLRARRHLGRQCGGIRRRSGCQGAGTTCSEVPAGSSPPRPQCSGRRSGPCREEIRTNVKQWQVRDRSGPTLEAAANPACDFPANPQQSNHFMQAVAEQLHRRRPSSGPASQSSGGS